MEDAGFLLRRNLGVVFVTVPLGLFVFSKLFPDRAKKTKQKCSAWLVDRVMRKVHSKCGQEKTDLFKSFDLVKVQRARVTFGFTQGSLYVTHFARFVLCHLKLEGKQLNPPTLLLLLLP